MLIKISIFLFLVPVENDCIVSVEEYIDKDYTKKKPINQKWMHPIDHNKNKLQDKPLVSLIPGALSFLILWTLPRFMLRIRVAATRIVIRTDPLSWRAWAATTMIRSNPPFSWAGFTDMIRTRPLSPRTAATTAAAIIRISPFLPLGTPAMPTAIIWTPPLSTRTGATATAIIRTSSLSANRALRSSPFMASPSRWPIAAPIRAVAISPIIIIFDCIFHWNNPIHQLTAHQTNTQVITRYLVGTWNWEENN